MTSQIGTVVESGDRSATVTRSTRETQITVKLRLDGTGETSIGTGVGFYDHLLNSLAHHALFDLQIEASGDLAIDEHHTVEDVALVFGAAWPRRSEIDPASSGSVTPPCRWTSPSRPRLSTSAAAHMP